MNTMIARVTGTGLFFLAIFLSGFWLSRMGKPYPTFLFTVHKMIALAAVVFLGVMVNRVHQSAPLQTAQMLAIALTALCLVAAIVTGGLVSVEKVMPGFVYRLHLVFPFLALASTGVTLYVLLFRNSMLSPVS